MCGDAAEVHPAGAVLDEHQDVHSLQQHGIHVQEIGREDPGSLGVQELPPGGVGAARCRVDAGGVQDLPDGGPRYGDAGLQQFAPGSGGTPQRILPRQALDTRGGRRTAGPAPPARVVLLRRQPAVPSHERRGRDGEHLGPTPAWHNPCERGEPGPVRRLVPHPADLPAQHRILMPEHQHFGRSRPVAAEQHDDQAEYPAGQHVDDLEQHPPSQLSPCPACRRQRRSTTQSNIRAVQGHFLRRFAATGTYLRGGFRFYLAQ